MNRIDRLFGLLTLLQARKYVPAEAIAEKFGISLRTVYRDIRALNEQGVPVSFEPQRGYFIVQGFFIPPVSFTSDEANALLLMETLVPGFADRSIHTHYASALQKVRAVLRTVQKERLEALDRSIGLQLPERLRIDSAFLSPLQEAIATRTIIELAYTDQQGEDSRRTAEPIGLVFYAFSWHLIAWCHLRQDYRDFRLSRIRQVCLTGQPFTRQDHMALQEYMKQLPVPY